MRLDTPTARHSLLGVALAVLVAGVVAVPLTTGRDSSGRRPAASTSEIDTAGGPADPDGAEDPAGAGDSTGDGDPGSTPGDGRPGPGDDPADPPQGGQGLPPGERPATGDGGAGVAPTTSTTLRRPITPGPGTTSTSRPGGGTAEGDPGPVAGTRPGGYRYELRQAPPGANETTRDLDLAVSGDSSRQTHVETYAQVRSEYVLVRRADALVEDVYVAPTTGDDEPLRCDWQGDMLVLALPLQRNLQWTSEGSCSRDQGSQREELRRRDDARVTGSERITIGGREVSCWVVERTQIVARTIRSGSTTSTQEVEHKVKQWWEPGTGLVAREERTYANTSRPTETHREIRVLKSLSPG